MIAALMSIIVTIALLISSKIENPVNLGLLIVQTQNADNINTIQEELKKYTTFLRLKNKTVNNNNVELIFEYKTKDNNIDSNISSISCVSSYSIMNYDRETRI